MLIQEKVKPIQPFRVDNGNIHGHVCIDLHNTKSGFTERIEGDNLVTNAAQDILNLAAIGYSTPPYNLLPLATNLLGGLFIFDGVLQENVNNVNFPGSQAKFVGSAGDRVDTSLNILGVRNNKESGMIQRGYKTVWDFSTNCCNGTIKSLARTSLKSGNNLRDFTNIFQGTKAILNNNRQTYSIFYQNDKLYIDNTIYESPLLGSTVSENADGTSEHLQPYSSSNLTLKDYVFSSNLNDISYSFKSNEVFSYKISTNEKTSLITLPSTIFYYGTYIIKGNYIYSIGNDFSLNKTELTNISNSIKLIDNICAESSNYNDRQYVQPFGKCLICSSYQYDNQGRYNYLIYDDNTIITIKDDKYRCFDLDYSSYVFFQDKPFVLRSYIGSNSQFEYYFYIIPFLGTIFNLPEAITKTANQTMKITYTLTNV